MYFSLVRIWLIVPPSPRATEVGLAAVGVQFRGQVGFGPAVFDELLVDPTHDLNFLIRPRDENDAIGLKWLLLPAVQKPLRFAGLVDEHAAEAESRRASLAITEFDQPALPLEDLGREFPAVLSGHGPFDALDDRRGRPTVVLELLRAVMHVDPGTLAEVLVEGRLVGILKPAPPADVVDEDRLEIDRPRLHLGDHSLEWITACHTQAALALVRVGVDDLEPAAFGVLPDDVGLVVGGILLMVRRHPNVLGGTDRRGGAIFGGCHGGIPVAQIAHLAN